MTLHHRGHNRAELIQLLEAGRSINMLAPRRIGKTWLMKRVAQDLQSMGWTAIYLDVQGMRSEQELLRGLCRVIERTQGLPARLKQHAQQRFEQLLGGRHEHNWEQAATTVDPRAFLDVLIEAMAKQGDKTVIMIDEIALFVLERVRADLTEARSLVYFLRSLQQAHPKVRWFLTGSIGLQAVARENGLEGAFLEYEPYKLDPFSREEAFSFVSSSEAQDIPEQAFVVNDASMDALVAELGWLSPFYLEKIVHRIRRLLRGSGVQRGAVVTTETVRAAVALLLEPEDRGLFAAWQEHLDKNFAPDTGRAMRAVLATLAAQPDGEEERTLQSVLQGTGSTISDRSLSDHLINLQLDGYVEKRGQRWQFRSGLLRRWWLEYVV